MYRLAELSDARRTMIGATLLILGLLGIALGVIWIHWASFPEDEVVDFLNWFPRGIYWKGFGYLIVFGATTLALIGGSMLWLLNQPMTWARATLASIISFMALVFYFGMVPSEWLNFAQTDLDWSSQRVALTIPSWLVLGNDVTLSWAFVKDNIQMAYSLGMLAFGGVFAIQIQKMKDGRPASAVSADPVSPYGRPLVKGD